MAQYGVALSRRIHRDHDVRCIETLAERELGTT